MASALNDTSLMYAYSMTWVIGMCTPFGYGAAISDIQVTLPSGQRLNCLRKVYALGPGFIGGFAGSVELGFKFLGNMAACLRSGAPGSYILPRAFAHKWHRFARHAFMKEPAKLRLLGCDLLMVGVSPAERFGGDGPWPRTDVIAMRSRTGFTPEYGSGFRSLSIGCGNAVEVYRRALEDPHVFVALEAGGNHGLAGGLAMRVQAVISRHPQPGVSRFTHLAVVRPASVSIESLNWTDCEADGTVSHHQMPLVARSWPDFCAVAARNGAVGAEAIA